MRWYWWIVLTILALNALVIVVVGIFLLFDHLRARRDARRERNRDSRKEVAG